MYTTRAYKRNFPSTIAFYRFPSSPRISFFPSSFPSKLSSPSLPLLPSFFFSRSFSFFFFSFQHRDERIERRGDEGEDRISVRTNAKITFHLAGHEEFIGTKVVGRAGRRRRAVPRSELKDYPAGRGQQRFKLLLYFRRQCTRTFQSRFESGVHDRLGNFETTTTRRTCPSGPFRLHLPGTHFPQLGNSTVRDPMDYLSPFLSISFSLSLPSSLGHKFA